MKFILILFHQQFNLQEKKRKIEDMLFLMMIGGIELQLVRENQQKVIHLDVV